MRVSMTMVGRFVIQTTFTLAHVRTSTSSRSQINSASSVLRSREQYAADQGVIARTPLEFPTKDQGATIRRPDLLRDHIRSSLRVARLLMDEVLDARFSSEQPDEYRKLTTKASGELAMLLRLARRALPDKEDVATISDLARDLAPVARAPHVVRSLFLRPSRAPMYALAHFCLVELGVPDEKLDRLARRALQSSVCAANERVPYRMLDAAWTRHLAYGASELDHPAIPLSPLGAGVDLLESLSPRRLRVHPRSALRHGFRAPPPAGHY